MEPTSESAPETPELIPPTELTKERLTDIADAWRAYAEQLAAKYKAMIPEPVKKYVSKPPEAETTAETA